MPTDPTNAAYSTLSSNSRVGATDGNKHQVTSDTASSGSATLTDEDNAGLGFIEYDLLPSWVDISFANPTNPNDPISGRAYYPGDVGLTIPAGAQVDGGIWFDRLERDAVADPVVIDGVSYAVAKRITALPDDWSGGGFGGLIPPGEHRHAPFIKRNVFGVGLPVPPASNVDGGIKAGDFARPSMNFGAQFQDWVAASGVLRWHGGRVGWSDANPGLRIKTADGWWYGLGINLQDVLNPNTKQQNGTDNALIGLFYTDPNEADRQSAVTGPPPNRDIRTDLLNAGGLGTLTPTTAGKWLVMQMYTAIDTPNGGRRLKIPEQEYRTKWEAYVAALSVATGEIPALIEGYTAPIALFVVAVGETDRANALIFDLDEWNQRYILTSGTIPDPPVRLMEWSGTIVSFTQGRSAVKFTHSYKVCTSGFERRLKSMNAVYDSQSPLSIVAGETATFEAGYFTKDAVRDSANFTPIPGAVIVWDETVSVSPDTTVLVDVIIPDGSIIGIRSTEVGTITPVNSDVSFTLCFSESAV